MVWMFISKIEEIHKHKYADLWVCLIFNGLVIMLLAWLNGSYAVLQNPWITSLCYVWSQYEPDV